MRHIARPSWLAQTAGSERPPSLTDPLQATGRTVGWGVVSTGNIADKVTAQLAQLQDARLVAVSSRSRARAEGFAARHGFARSYSDEGQSAYRRLAADPEVEVVYVATPHGQHFEVASAVLEAGKHVLLEKAFTINAWEARRLIELAAERGLFLMEALWTRFIPAYQFTLDLLVRGEIGDVTHVQAELGFMAPADPVSRLWARDAGGGALLDLGVYPLTWAVGALGYPQQVHAAGRLNAEGVDELEALTLSYEDGRQAQLLTSLVSAPVSQARIVGTRGTIRTEGSLTRPTGITVTSGTGGSGGFGRWLEPFDSSAPLYAYQLREVTSSVQRDLTESPTMPLQDSVRTMELFDEARRQLGVSYPNDERP